MTDYWLHLITSKYVIDYSWLRLQITITPGLEESINISSCLQTNGDEVTKRSGSLFSGMDRYLKTKFSFYLIYSNTELYTKYSRAIW